MGRPKKNADKFQIETATVEQLSKIISSTFHNYGKIEFLLSKKSSIDLLKNEYRRLRQLLQTLELSISNLKSPDKEVTSRLLLGTLDSTAQDLEEVRDKLGKVLRVLPGKINRYDEFTLDIKSDPGFNRAFDQVLIRKRKADAALNEALAELSDKLGGPAAVDRVFKKFPELVPSHLPASFDVNLIRKRIARHKKRD